MTDKIRHRLLAILAADAAGYSRLMSVDDIGTLDALEAARSAFRRHVQAEEGRIVDTSGDSVLAVFDTAAGAARAALLIQDELLERSQGLPRDRRLLFRIGIHLGDIVEKVDGTVYGDGVNIASRLQALAEPGAIVVSHAVEETASHHAQLEFKDIGEQRVKNIAKPVRAYRLSRPIDAAASAAPRSQGPAAPDPKPGHSHAAHRWRIWLATGALLVGAALFAVGAALRWQPSAPSVNIDEEVMARRALAVLAFNDRRQNSDGASFGDDLADAIGVQLQRNGMRVIQRSSTRTQDPAAPEFERIGAEQHVRFVLNGRITQSGEAVRVATNLTEISTGAVYRLFQADLRPSDDAGVARFARQVASALKARYFEIETTYARQPGRDKDPVDALVLAWRDLDRGGLDDLQSARHRFEFAVNADPNSLDAIAGLGVAHLTEFYYFYSSAPREKLDMAEQVLKRGLDLSQDNAQMLAAWAEVLMLRQKQDESLWMWKKSLEADPDDPGVHLRLASALVRQGRLVEAEQHIAQVSESRPFLVRDQQWLSQARADLAFAQQRDDEAYEVLRNWAAASPNSGRPYLMLAAIDALHGRLSAAKANMTRLRQMLPLSSVAYVELTYPSNDPGFLAQRARLIEGLRKAGLPEGNR
ncbi:MAG: hypothetical protein JSS14_05120 [Proteobacteria bacterium]|nr:hypothetical protein [Pseudomonadota bacterium]